MTRIKFGTSGWRGILADDFTLTNVRLVVQAICDYVKEIGQADSGLIIGRDPRFMGERFVDEAVRVIAANGIRAIVCSDIAPTPVISYSIIERKTAGGINFTASHNPPEYNGIKFSPDWGGPALPETTTRIEELANEYEGEMAFRTISLSEAREKKLYEIFDPRSDYMVRLGELVDFDAIGGFDGNLIVDLLWGAARGYLDQLLEVNCGAEVIKLHDWRDPFFGGGSPEPSEKNLFEMIELLSSDHHAHLGLSCDGDADRFGVVDRGGEFIQPNYILALVADYLVTERKLEGGFARSNATCSLIDRVAKKHDRELIETPVGFKYIGELIREDKIVIGGEESAGLTIKGHVPEKDGILACLLVAEMTARRRKSITEQLKQLYNEVGTVIARRENIRLSEEDSEGVAERLAATPDSFAGRKVIERNEIDGNKFILEGGAWILMRESGTEPVVRLYVEAGSEKEVAELLEAGRTLIKREKQ